MKRKVAALLMALAMTITVCASAAGSGTTRVQSLLSGMTLRQKITQMLMVDFRYWNGNGFTAMNDEVAEIISTYDFGAVIYFKQNLVGTGQAYELTTAIQRAAVSNGGIPMIITCDQEGGTVFRLQSGTALPGNMAVGATGDFVMARDYGRVIGSELSALGINSVLAPVVDVNSNANNTVIGLRSFGDDPILVGNMAAAEIEGLKDFCVVGCAKHFPGHGDTATDSHYGLPRVNKTLAELKDCELKPYEIAIDKGVEMIMTAHILYPQLEKDKIYSEKTGAYESLPATMSDDIITGLLKTEMGFNGIVVTDAMNMQAVSKYWSATQACVNAIAAGADMICMPISLRGCGDIAALDKLIDGIASAVNNGKIPLSRIDDAVTRILTVKENSNILDWRESDYSLEKAKATVGSAENRELERKTAAAAVTLTKNENNTLPLKPTENSKILMLSATSSGRSLMAIGWNRAKAAGVVPDGAEVKIMSYESATSITSFKSPIEWADTVIITSAVSSAKQVANGDWRYSTLQKLSDYAQSLGKTLVTISTDKPYDVQHYGKSQAVLAVYGSAAFGVDVTEALIGNLTETDSALSPNIIAGVEVAFGVFGARGRLPVDVPVYSNGRFTSKTYLSRGYGLTYDSDPTLHSLAPVAQKKPTCLLGGNTAYYTCKHCGLWFYDIAAQERITDKSAILIPPVGHTDSDGDLLCDLCGGETFILGDADGNGVLDKSDCALVKRACMAEITLSPAQKKAADFNRDGVLNVLDYVMIKRFILYN